jgi:murein DD-endopeptidase MepM/ murein hydrolase activator NlpD
MSLGGLRCARPVPVHILSPLTASSPGPTGAVAPVLTATYGAAMSFASAVAALVLALVNAAGQTAASPPPSAGTVPPSGVRSLPVDAVSAWTWPLRPRPDVVAGFNPPDVRWGSGHRGVDLGAQVGQEVHAPAAGVVSFAGVIAGRGVVVVEHAGGLRSTFEPVTGIVPVGSPVGQGDPVGEVADALGHCAPSTCLHWGLLRGETHLDPLSMLTRRPIVLLPLS